MSLTTLLTITFLTSTVAANLFSSGMFLVRISSEERHNVQYCFTELPYTVRRSPNSRCLKSGELNVAKKTERVIDLRLMNSTSAYLTVEFDIAARGQGPSKIITERVVVDGALPAKRIAVASGLVLEFVTICDRPWYGLMCSRYCIERNDANYVCDPRGEKVCLVGWTGKDCDIGPAVASTTASAGVTFSSSSTTLATTTELFAPEG
ncbi:delta serrate ligand [Ancylostoma duodenale]|uniref:Delta-like protein n=1 Tax=Ancylostoma duodenale TaxID=51022 RepID=A0A0C2FUV3_9BILA|nr:delta serrate ligand [Ancylostoma duodenale]